jgi:hypothetical protein
VAEGVDKQAAACPFDVASGNRVSLRIRSRSSSAQATIRLPGYLGLATWRSVRPLLDRERRTHAGRRRLG